jgi:hypothetical protein
MIRSITFKLLLLTCISTLLFLLLACSGGMAQKAKKKLKEQDIIQRVLKDYDWRVRPRGYNDSWPGTSFHVVPRFPDT